MLESIVKLIDPKLELIYTAKNVDHEFYWQHKCHSQLKNCRKEDHGNSYKQAYIERKIQELLENHKDDASNAHLIEELDAARFEVFCLKISQLLSHLDMGIVFQHLPNLSYLTLTYGAKHVGMEYERPLFGMKMGDANILSN